MTWYKAMIRGTLHTVGEYVSTEAEEGKAQSKLCVLLILINSAAGPDCIGSMHDSWLIMQARYALYLHLNRA